LDGGARLAYLPLPLPREERLDLRELGLLRERLDWLRSRVDVAPPRLVIVPLADDCDRFWLCPPRPLSCPSSDSRWL
jgi:hypothetical protein